MAKRKAANGVADVNGDDASALDATTSATAPEAATSSGSRRILDDIVAASTSAARDPVKVNNMNASDLKNACDDAVKKLLSQPELFQEIQTHTDVKLALGWASVAIAGATALYGWKIDFEQSKPLVWAGVILYILLTSVSTLYTFFVEKDTVYVGRRKSLAKRIETERLTVTSRTLPPLARGNAPRYHASIAYVRSSNGGKSLLRKGHATQERAYSEFFAEDGVMDQERFARWLGALVEPVMEGR